MVTVAKAVEPSLPQVAQYLNLAFWLMRSVPRHFASLQAKFDGAVGVRKLHEETFTRPHSVQCTSKLKLMFLFQCFGNSGQWEEESAEHTSCDKQEQAIQVEYTDMTIAQRAAESCQCTFQIGT